MKKDTIVETTKRQPGFYWVKVNEEWTISYWDSNYFWLNGDDFSEGYFLSIDEQQIVRQ